MEMIEKVAYLKGLAEGLGLDDSTKEGRVLKLVIDLLDDVVLALSDMGESFDMLGEQIESMDEDLEEVLSDLYEDDDEDDDEDGECRCKGHHHKHGHELFEGELYEVVCPSCGDSICIDEDMLDEGEIKCPGCGEMLEFDLDGTLDCDDEESKDDAGK